VGSDGPFGEGRKPVYDVYDFSVKAATTEQTGIALGDCFEFT
jgi:hypothetical protein